MDAALNRAYDLERKGLEFYISVAVKSKNALVKRTLFSLAQEEIKHMMKIDEISLSIGKDLQWESIEASLNASDIEISIRVFFEKTKKDLLLENKDNVDLIKKAMDFERESYALYKELSAAAEKDAQRSFYEQLKRQEEEHYEALENVYSYLTETGDWFGKEESRVWNWMNL